MTAYIIAVETRDQLIDLLEAVGQRSTNSRDAMDAVNILPHLRRAPVVNLDPNNGHAHGHQLEMCYIVHEDK